MLVCILRARQRCWRSLVGRAWTKLEKWPWRLSIQQGLAPVSIGLLLAGTLSMAKGAVTGWTTGGIASGVLLTMLWRKSILLCWCLPAPS